MIRERLDNLTADLSAAALERPRSLDLAHPRVGLSLSDAQAAPPRHLHLLLVESNDQTARALSDALTSHFGADCITHVETVADALAVDPREVDMVLTDMSLPDGTGLDLLRALLRCRADLPVVVVTNENVYETAVEAIRRGAYDYIVKTGDYLFSMPLVVEKNLAIWHTKQENGRLQAQLAATLEEVRVKNQQLEQVVAQLATVAATDPLTGLANRRALSQALGRSVALARRHGESLACLIIDLDGFKQFNDTLGHPVGDRLLQAVSEVLLATCRRSDVAGRLGGDEFILLLPDTDADQACRVAQRVAQRFDHQARKLLRQIGRDVRISMSMGLACLRDCDGDDPEQLVTLADRALYRAKQAGRMRLALHHRSQPIRLMPKSAAASPVV